MPGGDRVDAFRIVVDESSLNFCGHADDEVQDALAAFNDVLAELVAKEHAVASWSGLYETECRSGLALHDFLFDPSRSEVSRDERLRLSSALSRLSCWDENEPAGVPLDVVVAGRDGSSLAPSVGYALNAAMGGFGVACVVFPLSEPQGFCHVSGECGEDEVFFFASVADIRIFWRSVLNREQAREEEFFERAKDAFPGLVLHGGLSFSRFDGSYADLRGPVIRILSIIGDEFARVWSDRIGMPHEVEGEMRSLGVVMTRESVKTRASSRYMAMRDVDYNGNSYRCEWHAKLEPHRNRIHFALPAAELSGDVLIGLFVDHLPTP